MCSHVRHVSNIPILSLVSYLFDAFYVSDMNVVLPSLFDKWDSSERINKAVCVKTGNHIKPTKQQQYWFGVLGKSLQWTCGLTPFITLAV